MADHRQEALRSLPAVHRLLGMAESTSEFVNVPDWLKTEALRTALDELRAAWESPAGPPDEAWWETASKPTAIIRRAGHFARERFAPRLRPVFNLTGTILHTNLGRAPLSDVAVRAVTDVARGYSNLEYDLASGTRGSRHSHVESLICELTGAESAVVVNNNAAAALLVLRALAAGGEGIVSRGQLVEIGGSFRIPDIMRESGVDLVEVGTTNKTRLQDYEHAMSECTRVILRVHTSNFRIIGFTEQPELAELVELSHRHGLPVYQDLGSGAIFDYASRGIGDEPTVQHSIHCGVDVVTFSGDKLLGGAQAGLIIGKSTWIERIRSHPLMRALRVDKMTLAALEATLLAHLDDERAQREIPVVRMLSESYADVSARAERICACLRETLASINSWQIELADDVSRIGGGALPEEALPTRVIRLAHRTKDAQHLLIELRSLPDIPIIARVAKEQVIFDIRTLLPDQEPLFIAELQTCLLSLV